MNRTRQAVWFEAVIFDLDGVITQTSRIHSRAWEILFTDFLTQLSKTSGLSFRKFTHDPDYLEHVDGKPRYLGVDSFLRSRNIRLPWGSPSDPPDKETVCGLGNKKNELFHSLVSSEGIVCFPSTLQLIKELNRIHIPVGVASSSKNCRYVLHAARIEDYFQTVVDGKSLEDLGLKGKPEPDIFLTACSNLKARPEKTIVVEDAVSGIQAGKRGGFGLVIGIARENNREELLAQGADVVVMDLSEINGIPGLSLRVPLL